MICDELFDFSINKERSTIHIKREFAAELELVWQSWTLAKLLDQWWAPSPYRTETKTMDFRVGGVWHYALVSPGANKHWCRSDYKTIESYKHITELRSFSDEFGTIDPAVKPTECNIDFTYREGKTLVAMLEKYTNPKMFERMATDSHKKGFSAHLINLDKLLLTLK
jgi:uncharacterized protein YndB with AHSA1/START domain